MMFHKLNHNAAAIAGMRLSHKVFDLSLDLFVTLFLWNEAGHDLGLLCLYRCIYVVGIFLAMISSVKMSRMRGRKWIMAGGRVLLLVYTAMLVAFGHESIRHIAPLAAMHGIGCGLYYVIYNQYEAEGVSGSLSGRSGFLSIYQSVSTVVKALYPFLMGVLMDRFGLLPVGISCAISSLSVILCAVWYDDQGCKDKVSFSTYFRYLKKNKDAKHSALWFAACDFFRAFTFSYASFSLFLSVCLMDFLGGADSFGAANSLLFLFAMAFSLCFKRLATRKEKTIWTGQKLLLAMMVLSGLYMFLGQNAEFSFGLFLLFFNSYEVTDSMVYSTATGMFAKCMVSGHISECFVVNEAVLTVGRILGYAALWLSWEAAGNLRPGTQTDDVLPVLLFLAYMAMTYFSYRANRKLWMSQKRDA